MKITVGVLTIPDRKELLDRSVESILSQTFEDFEVIIATADSQTQKNIADKYTDSRISVIPCGEGIGAGRNEIVKQAAGEYITFVDDDDYIEPDFLKTLHTSAAENKADIAICGVKPDFDLDETLVFDKTEGMKALILGEYFSFNLPGKLFSRHLFENVSFPQDRRLDGVAVCWKLFAATQKTICTGEGLYIYNKHENRVRYPDDDPTLLTPDYIVEHLGANGEREEYIAANMPEILDIARYGGWAYMVSMIEKIVRLGIAPCYAPLRYMRNEMKTYWQEFMYSPYPKDFEKAWVQMYV